MAYKAAFVVVGAMILLAAVADAQILQPPISTVNVGGILNCPSATGPAIPGAAVSLNCTILGVSVALGQGVTSANGTFNISVSNIVGALLPVVLGAVKVLPCNVGTTLPINQTVCPILNTANALLLSVPTLVNITLNALSQLVATAVAIPIIVGSVAVSV